MITILVFIFIMLWFWEVGRHLRELKRVFNGRFRPGKQHYRRVFRFSVPDMIKNIPRIRLKRIYKINKWNYILDTGKQIPYDTDMADKTLKELYYNVQRIYHASIGRTKDSLDDLIQDDVRPLTGRPEII